MFPQRRPAATLSHMQTVAQPIAQPIEHLDIIHDIQYDYYGQQLATASSDRTIGIYQVAPGSAPVRKATLTGHKGAVWMVSWASPKYGNVIASAGYDRKAIIWKETRNSQWSAIHVVDVHQGSVNALEWAPQEFGAVLATASSDGSVGITDFLNGCWQQTYKISNNSSKIAHAMGATSVSFAPFHVSYPKLLLLASGGCDRQIRIWNCVLSDSFQKSFSLLCTLNSNSSEKITDVAFCPSCASSRYLVLAASYGKRVSIRRKQWKDIVQSDTELSKGNENWELSVVELKDPVWRLSWSPCGELLLATTATSEVLVLHEGAVFTDPWIFQPIS